MTKQIISWESQHLEFDTKNGRIKVADDAQNQTVEGVQAAYADDDDDNFSEESGIMIQEVMSTPFGYWKVDDSMNPLKQFKLWMGHTNFTITQEVVETIKQLEGVEVLYILTRYRFIVGVGALFDFHDVRLAIEKAVCSDSVNTTIDIHDDEVRKNVETLKSELASTYEKWAIYVFPNGNIDYIAHIHKKTGECGFTESEFNDQVTLYKQAVDKSNGILIQSS